jgi:hypothetical protein
MLTFRFNQALFTHVIAARDINYANDAIAKQFLKQGTLFNGEPIQQWHTPDVWTRRAVDMALAPAIIDTIPRFVVDRKDGPVYLGIDDVPAKLSPADVISIEHDGPYHAAWLMLCIVEKERGEMLRAHVARIASEPNPKHYAKMVRALAGAWGLGPIPEWHAAILPALIALDVGITTYANGTPVTWFESDSDELLNHLSVIRDDDIAGDLKSCARHIAHSINCFRPVGTTCSDYVLRRAWAQSAMSIIGWLPRANLRDFIESIDKASSQ